MRKLLEQEMAQANKRKDVNEEEEERRRRQTQLYEMFNFGFRKATKQDTSRTSLGRLTGALSGKKPDDKKKKR